MRIKVLACETLRDEFTYLFDKLELDAEVIWIESGLHNYPDKLRKRLQEEIDRISECERLILLFGRCGNSIVGVKTGNFEMIIPKVDDCISLLMGSDERRREFSRENACYYLTEGWMRGERNLWVEYRYSVEKYGEETAREIADMMYSNYRTLALLDTGVTPIKNLEEKTQIIEETLNLKRTVVAGTLDYMRELLTGPWDESRYEIIPPYGIVQVGKCINKIG